MTYWNIYLKDNRKTHIKTTKGQNNSKRTFIFLFSVFLGFILLFFFKKLFFLKKYAFNMYVKEALLM